MRRSYILKSSKTIEQNLYPFLKVKDELSIVKGIIFRGSRDFILLKFSKFEIIELH